MMWIFIFFGIHVYNVDRFSVSMNLKAERIKEYFVLSLEDRLADIP
jgi:hypothetical protein